MKDPRELIGKTEEEALLEISKAGLTARINSRDGKYEDPSSGLNKSRVNLDIKGGSVIWATAG